MRVTRGRARPGLDVGAGGVGEERIRRGRMVGRAARRGAWRRGVAGVLATALAPFAAAQPDATPAAETQSAPALVGVADLRQALARLRRNMGMLRWVAGESRVDTPPWAVAAATPRHVLWQAQVLFGRAVQLAEEVAGSRILPLPEGSWRRSLPRSAPQGRDVRLDDALLVIEDAHDRIRAAIRLQNIRIVGGESQQERQRGGRNRRAAADEGGLGEVLAQIVQAIRQLDLLLYREVLPREAYNEVMTAMDRAGDLTAGFYPARPPLVAGRRPQDVYEHLLTCMELLMSADAAADVQVLRLSLDQEVGRERVTLADVQQLATTLRADLDHVAMRLNSARTRPPKGEYPRRPFVFPSHIDQMVGVLEVQLRRFAGRPGGQAATDAE